MYKIQTLVSPHQWESIFFDSLDDSPVTFETIQQAKEELDCLLSELKTAYKHGHVAEYTPEIYRIVRSDNEL